jgi:hypothetical protein
LFACACPFPTFPIRASASSRCHHGFLPLVALFSEPLFKQVAKTVQ